MARCGTLWHIVVHCGTLWHVVVHCGTLWYIVARCGTLWHVVAHCGSPKSNLSTPRSPDPSAPDFFLWGDFKEKVYIYMPDTLRELNEN